VSRRPSHRPRLGRYALRAASLVAALGLWQLLTSLDINLWLRFSQFPTVTDVAGAFADRLGGADYWTDLTDSLTRIITGGRHTVKEHFLLRRPRSTSNSWMSHGLSHR